MECGREGVKQGLTEFFGKHILLSIYPNINKTYYI